MRSELTGHPYHRGIETAHRGVALHCAYIRQTITD